jgi:hypothetical protein
MSHRRIADNEIKINPAEAPFTAMEFRSGAYSHSENCPVKAYRYSITVR